MHPSGVETAGESHLQQIAVLVAHLAGLPRHGGIDRLAVDLADGGDIFRGLEPSLDLEAGDPAFDQLRDVVHRGEILGGEKVASVPEITEGPIHHQLVRHPAGLGALSPVGTPLAEGFTGEALAGVGDAQGAVDKHLQGHPLRVEALQFAQRELACQHGTGDTEPLGYLHALRRGECHLGRGVDRQFGHNGRGKPHETDVLDDQGIHSGAVEQSQVLGGIIELPGEDEGVQRDVGLHPVAVAEGGDFGKLLFGEVVGTETCIETGEPKEDRVGPIRHGGPQALPSAGGSEKLGT